MAECFNCGRPHGFLVKVVFTINTSSMCSVEDRLFCPSCFREHIGLAANKEASTIVAGIIDFVVEDLPRYFPELEGELTKYGTTMRELHRRLIRILEGKVKQDA